MKTTKTCLIHITEKFDKISYYVFLFLFSTKNCLCLFLSLAITLATSLSSPFFYLSSSLSLSSFWAWLASPRPMSFLSLYYILGMTHQPRSFLTFSLLLFLSLSSIMGTGMAHQPRSSLSLLFPLSLSKPSSLAQQSRPVMSSSPPSSSLLDFSAQKTTTNPHLCIS